MAYTFLNRIARLIYYLLVSIKIQSKLFVEVIVQRLLNFNKTGVNSGNDRNKL
jgi:hypothetical protein